MDKYCVKCNKNKSLNDFEKAKRCKDGHLNTCKDCRKAKKRKVYNEFYARNKKRVVKEKQQWKNNNREKLKKYKRENKEICAHHRAKRRAMKVKATLDGYDSEIKEIYKSCPKGYHVDHIMPLISKKICGLHVPWNLQYLTPEENARKSNKIIGDR